MSFSSQIFFNNIIHGYRAAPWKKSSLWLLPFFMAVTTHWEATMMKSWAEWCALQLLCNFRNIFLENSYTKLVKKLFPEPFLKIKIEHVSRSIMWMSSWGLRCRPLTFTSYKNKKRSETSLPVLFFAWFLKKNIFFVIFY